MNKSLVDFEIDLRGIEVLREWKSIENACGGDDSKCRCRVGTRTKVCSACSERGRKKTAISAKFVTTIYFVGCLLYCSTLSRAYWTRVVTSPAEENN